MLTSKRKKKNSCNRCGLMHHEGPLYLCLKCAAVLCRNQLAVKVSVDDDVWHRLTDGRKCGPVVRHEDQGTIAIDAIDMAEEGPDLSHVTVYRVSPDGTRTVIYTVATPKRESFCTVDLSIRSDAPGLGGGQHMLVPQLVVTEGEKLEVDFGDYPSKKEDEECRVEK